MQQRTIIFTVKDDAQTNRVYIQNNDTRIGYSGEHKATIIKFSLPESWLADAEVKYQLYFLTADGRKYCTEMLDTAEFALPAALMISGGLYLQLLQKDNSGNIIKKTEYCRCEVASSVSGIEVIAEGGGVKLVEELNEELLELISDTENAESSLSAEIENAQATERRIKSITALNKTILFDGNGIPIWISDKTNFTGGDAEGITNATILFVPSTVTLIGGGSFSGCDKITDVYVDNTADNIFINNVFSTDIIHYNDSKEFAEFTALDLAENALYTINCNTETNDRRISSAVQRVGVAETDITQLKTRTSAAESNISVNTANITKLQTRTNAAETNISDNTTDITTNAAAINKLQNITALEKIIIFDDNGVPIFISSLLRPGGGFAAGLTAAKTMYIPKTVTAIEGGSFSGCDNLSDVYIDNTADKININSGVFADTVAIHYNDSDEFAEFAALESTENALYTINRNIATAQTDINTATANIADNTAAIADLQGYIGYTDNDIVGLQVDYENKQFTRLAGAVGKTAGADFDVYSMYGGRRRCNVADDGTINAYYGDDDYTDDGSNGQVMVYQPKFYYRVVPLKLDPNTETGIGYHIRKANYYVSATPKAGFKLHPAFYNEAGAEVDYVLFSAYEGSLYGVSAGAYVNDGTDTSTEMDLTSDLMCSAGGVKPISGLYKKLTLQNAEALASNRGAGWHIDTVKSVSAQQLLMMIECGTMNSQTAIGQSVVNITDDANCNCASLTGSTAALGNATGQATETINTIGTVQTVYTENGKTAISYRGVENPWGNIWKLINGVNAWGNGLMAGGQIYIADDFAFDSNKHTENYQPVGFTLPNSNGYINAMGYGNEKYDWLLMPSEIGGTSVLPVGDYSNSVNNLDGYKIFRLGSNNSGASAAGAFYWNSGSTAGATSKSFGGRLIYVPQTTTSVGGE